MIRLLDKTRRHDITFYRNGRILITARVVRMLGLSPGDSINIAITDGEYLLYALHNPFGRHEAQCYPTKRGSHNFCANSARLTRAVLDASRTSASRASFMIGEQIIIQHTLYCPIIIRHPL